MKKVLRYFAYGSLGVLLIILFIGIFFWIRWNITSSVNMELLGDPVPMLVKNGYRFRDLNKNGKLDAYEDNRVLIDSRVDDLINQMELEEKAGLMFITLIAMNNDGSLSERPVFSELITLLVESSSTMVVNKRMNHFNIIQSTSPKAMAIWNNNIQKLAERTRLGIPITIATDPRHGADENVGASVPTPFYSKWCSPLGFAAIRDSSVVQEFANIARQEYMALGIRLALSPMADLATEPRWSRIGGTFGEDAELSAKLTKAYVMGFQGDNLGTASVACMTKHFSGGGPQKDGEDPHFPYGAEQVYPGNYFDYHLIPFDKGAFLAKTAQIMPYYGIPVGQTSEDVGFGYNKDIITGLLRGKYGFDGVVCTDWGLISDVRLFGKVAKPASAHGVEHLSVSERMAKIIDAGCDMFGGEALPEVLVELTRSGKIKEERLNISVRRILRDKFRLGLFENPYVDTENLSIVANKDFVEKGKESQRKSMVLLKNEENILPIKKGVKIYVEGIDKSITEKYTNVVSTSEEADYIILRLRTPFDTRDKYFLEQFFHQGTLSFTEEENSMFLKLMDSKPTITVINLERPAVIPEINSKTKGLVADFGSSDEIILELIFGEFQPTGKLPFELPSSMQAVENQKEDVPYDSKDPLYPFGFGMSF